MVKIVASAEEFDKELKDAGDKTVIVDFTATWCGPCKMIGPEFEKFSGEFTNVVFLKVDVDDCGDVAEKAGVSAMPTFKVYKNGAIVDELVGASKEKLKDLIERNK